MSIHIHNKANFYEALNQAGGRLVLVDFYATWCGPCNMIAPTLEQIAQQYPNVIVLKVDVDQCQDLAAEFAVSAMPTFLFIKNMQKLETVTGADAQRLFTLVANLQ